MKSLQVKMPFGAKLSMCIGPLKYTIQVTVLFLFFAFSSQGQDLATFKKSASGDGIDAIPYSDLEGKASTLQTAKKNTFTAIAGYNGKRMLDSKENSLGIKKQMTEDLKKAKDKLDDDDGESSSTTNSLKANVKNLTEKLEDVTDEIAEMDKKINEGLKRWQAYLDVRFDMDQVYAEVKKRLASSKSYPHKHIDKPLSSDTEGMKQYDKDVILLKGYIDDIDDTIDKGKDDHKQAIQDAVNAITNLEDAQRLR
jgi:DNA repair ATPase RecN